MPLGLLVWYDSNCIIFIQHRRKQCNLPLISINYNQQCLLFTKITNPSLLICPHFALQAREPTIKVLLSLVQPFVSFFIVFKLLLFVHVFHILFGVHHGCCSESKAKAISRSPIKIQLGNIQPPNSAMAMIYHFETSCNVGKERMQYNLAVAPVACFDS